MCRNSAAPTSRRRSRSLVTAATVYPATSVPSRSKNAPTPGPSGLASTSATDPGRRSGVVMRSPPGGRRFSSSRTGGRPPQLHDLVEPGLKALLQLVGGGERRGVVAERHGAGARPGDEDRHHAHPGQRAEPVLPLHPRPGQERLLGVAGHVAGLDVGRGDPLEDLVERLVGEQGQDRRQPADHVDGGLAPPRDHLLADLPHPLDRIGFADRRGDGDPGEPVARRRVVPAAQADRQRQREGVDRHPEHLVVPAQAAAQRGQVGVVDRRPAPPGYFDRLGRRAQVGERQLRARRSG